MVHPMNFSFSEYIGLIPAFSPSNALNPFNYEHVYKGDICIYKLNRVTLKEKVYIK